MVGQAARADEKQSQGTMVKAGAANFEKYCLNCHDAKTSLAKRKSLAQWRTTVLKMSKKEDADIPVTTHESIAVYLADNSTKLPPGDDSASQPSAQAPTDEKTKPGGDKKADDGKEKADSAAIKSGETAFNAHCLQCHDAQTSTAKIKSASEWKSTIQRMAEKPGAQIPANTFDSIAAYLASLGSKGGSGEKGGKSEASHFSFSGTVSPSFRTSGNGSIEYPDFFGDLWLSAAWQGSGPVSARATSCISCHADGNQYGRFELVEASLRLDVTKWLHEKCPADAKANLSVEAGRLVVPFGAYYQEVNPAVARSVTAPLIYSMGQRVRPNDIGDPVLPMPYCDNGAMADVNLKIDENVSATFNAYVVNGLEGNAFGPDFYASRAYVDNNSAPAIGGRLALIGKYFRAGTSIMGGRFNSDAGDGPLGNRLDYVIVGADASFRYKDVIRVQFEYAERDNDRIDQAVQALTHDRVGGSYVEAEVLVDRCHRVNFFTRYDTQARHSSDPPPGSLLASGSFGVDRFTYGLNWTLPGGSLLMVNHEHWFLPGNLPDVDVLGVRWAASF